MRAPRPHFRRRGQAEISPRIKPRARLKIGGLGDQRKSKFSMPRPTVEARCGDEWQAHRPRAMPTWSSRHEHCFPATQVEIDAGVDPMSDAAGDFIEQLWLYLAV